MKKIKNIFVMAVALSLVSGCFTFGKSFNSNINWVKKGETNQKDVLLVMGQPQEVGNSGGVPTWTYYHYSYKIVGHDSRKEIKFYWNSDKSLNHFSFTTSFPEDLKKAETGAVR